MKHLTELFCQIDDFCQIFEPQLHQHLIENQKRTRQRQTSITLSELMTITVMFHQLRYRQFKTFYIDHVKAMLSREFPNLPSYNRCIELMPRCLLGLCAFFQTIKAPCTGISFIDATALAVCHNRRIKQHRVFADTAQRGKTSVGWFFGFKLHLVINHLGGIVDCKLTAGNTDDRKPVGDLCQHVYGMLTGDKGYLSEKLTQQLHQSGIQLLTPIRRKMKKRPKRTGFELYLLQHRALIETVIDQLKNQSQIQHTRHRSMTGFLVNLMSGLVAYALSSNKPKLSLSKVQALQVSA